MRSSVVIGLAGAALVQLSVAFSQATRSHLFSLPKTSSTTQTRRFSAETTTANIDAEETTEQSPIASTPKAHYDSIIVGGGPAGILTAIMMAQKYGPSHKIALCERRPSLPPSPSDQTVWDDIARFYLLGIGHRGQTALTKFGVMEDFVKASVAVNGRRDWQPGKTKLEDGNITPARKDVTSRVLARDKLVGLLHHHLVDNYITTNKADIDLLYGYEVNPISFGDEKDAEDDLVRVQISKCQDVGIIGTGIQNESSNQTTYMASQDSEQTCDVDTFQISSAGLLIGADGAARAVANAMEEYEQKKYQSLNPIQKLVAKKPFFIKKFEDDNPRVYKSVPIRLPEEWGHFDLNYSSRSPRVTLEALPSDDKGSLCALLLMKPDDELAQPDVPSEKLRAYFDEHFPQFGALVDDEEMARVAQKPSSRLPVFRYAGPRLHLGRRTLVLGDAAHTVKPYYGLGANTALEDVQILSDVLDETKDEEDSIGMAVQKFSKLRAADSEALVTISRNMDRPGKLFFVNFILPLILDGMFQKLPFFDGNMFTMFQKRGVGFKYIQPY